MAKTEMRLSASRVTRAVLPFGAMAMALGPDFSPPTVTLADAVTVLPARVKTETVPSSRLATSASVPALLIAIPEDPLPAASVVRTFGTAGGDLTPTTDLMRP